MVRNPISLILILAVLLVAGCSVKSEERKIYNKDFNWTITIPAGFDSVKAEDWEKMQSKGTAAMEDTFGQEVVNQAKIIFVFKSGQFNYLESNYQPFDETIDGDHLQSVQAVTQVLYETFKAQMPGVEIDTSRSVKKIDNLEFQASEMIVHMPNDYTLNFFSYSRLFDKKEFTVNIVYTDETKGQQMKAAWQSSSFSK